MTHTSAPWHLDTKTAVESYFDDVNVLRDDGLAVAVALHNGNIAPEEAMANGKLIAAAPELLAELKGLHRAYVNLLEVGRDRITTLGGDCDPVDKMEGDDPNLRAVRALIAKIEG